MAVHYESQSAGALLAVNRWSQPLLQCPACSTRRGFDTYPPLAQDNPIEIASQQLLSRGSPQLPADDHAAYRRLFLPWPSGEIPTQVVNPSVSRATVPQGTALTVFVETPSPATVFRPGPLVVSGNGPVE